MRLVPSITLIPFDLVLAKQGAQLVLISHLLVMLLLPADVILYRIQI